MSIHPLAPFLIGSKFDAMRHRQIAGKFLEPFQDVLSLGNSRQLLNAIWHNYKRDLCFASTDADQVVNPAYIWLDPTDSLLNSGIEKSSAS